MSRSFFNDEQIRAINSGDYWCPECYERMEWESENEDILVCPHCGFSMDSEHYGFTDEEYEELYPTREEVLAMEGNNDEE